MSTLCPDCEPPWTSICDFCKHYKFNGEDLGGKHGLVYVEKGFCSLHCLPSDPDDGCEYFYCIMADKKEDK